MRFSPADTTNIIITKFYNTFLLRTFIISSIQNKFLEPFKVFIIRKLLVLLRKQPLSMTEFRISIFLTKVFCDSFINKG